MTHHGPVGLAFLMLLAFWMHPPAVFAGQSAVERDLDEAKVLYREGHIDEAVGALRKVITQLNQLRDQQGRRVQLADAHFHLGLSYFALRDESAALENFRQVVALDPARTLDQNIYSPKVIDLFEQARADVGANRTDAAAKSDARETTEAKARATRAGNLQPGTRVRLWFQGDRGNVKGNLLSVDERSVALVTPENVNLTLPREQVTKVEVVKDRRGHWLLGAVVGVSFGAIVGALEKPGCEGNDGDCYTRGENIGYGALGAGIVGALLGALSKTEEWAEVPFEPVVTAARPADRRIAVSFVWRY